MPKPKPNPPTKRTRGQPRNPAVDELVKTGGYTRRGARKVLAEAKTTGESLHDLQSARLRKVKLEGDKLEFSLQVLRGDHIPKDKVAELLYLLGVIVSAQLNSGSQDLPGRLEGLTAAQMKPILSELFDKIKKSLADAIDKELTPQCQ